MRRLLVASLLLVLPACAEDTPTITQPGTAAPVESPTSDAAEGDIVIEAGEYKFHGVPEALSAGLHRFAMDNVGEEPHVFYLFHIPGEESVEELLDLPEKKVNKLTQAVDRAEAGPGGSAEFEADLVPGRFGYVCFINTEDGTPHFALGMYGEFTAA